MTVQEKELLITIARILRAHLGDHINEGPCHKYSHEDFRDLQAALKPFDAELAKANQEGTRQPHAI